MSILTRAAFLFEKYGRQRITQTELAEQLGCTPGHIKNLQSQKKLGIPVIKEGSKVFFDIMAVAEYLENSAKSAAA